MKFAYEFAKPQLDNFCCKIKFFGQRTYVFLNIILVENGFNIYCSLRAQVHIWKGRKVASDIQHWRVNCCSGATSITKRSALTFSQSVPVLALYTNVLKTLPKYFLHYLSYAFYCRWDGDKTAFDPEYENGETRDSETDLWLGQPLKWPTDGKEY